MDKWIAQVQKELGLSVDVDVDSLLLVARDAAHSVERKMAPVTTYLIGIAVAQGASVAEVSLKISELAKAWTVESA